MERAKISFTLASSFSLFALPKFSRVLLTPMSSNTHFLHSYSFPPFLGRDVVSCLTMFSVCLCVGKVSTENSATAKGGWQKRKCQGVGGHVGALSFTVFFFAMLFCARGTARKDDVVVVEWVEFKLSDPWVIFWWLMMIFSASFSTKIISPENGF